MPNALHADLVLKGATILTMDAKDSVAQTVAVKHGRIVGVGTDADVEGLIGRGTHVLDCRGKTIVPGFIDSHTHNTLVGEFRYSFDQLNTAAELNPTLEGLLAKIKERAAGVSPGEWIGGRNYDPNAMREGRWPTRHELDAVAPLNPVLITIRGGHACVANTRALELAGITRDTPDPEGGVIDRDEAGDPTGVRTRPRVTPRQARPLGTVRLSPADEEADRPFPRHEEVGTAPHGDEIAHAFKAQRPPLRGDGQHVAQPRATGERIDLVLEPVKARPEHVGLLHKLELSLDVRVHAHEQQTRMPQPVLRGVAAADAEDAVPVGDRQLVLGSRLETVARVDAADVGAERAAQAVRVFGAEQEIVVGQRARPAHRSWLIRMPDQRRAIRPAAEHLRADPGSQRPGIARGDPRVANQACRRVGEKCIECGFVLFELAHHEVGAVVPQVEVAGGGW